MARAEKRKYHYIYKITCNVTNRFYIGMHSTDNLDDGYFGSGKRLWFSINYHGKEDHIKEILEFLPSRQLLKKREKEIVTKDLIGEELCMNLQEGGGGGFSSEEHRIKFITQGTKRGREIVNNKYGHLLSKWGSKGGKKSGNIHKIYSWVGKKHSIETKNKISNTKKGVGVGKANSQYGTCWITKDGINKKIKKEELNIFTQNGWCKGRQLK